MDEAVKAPRPSPKSFEDIKCLWPKSDMTAGVSGESLFGLDDRIGAVKAQDLR